MIKIRHHLDLTALHAILSSPQGGVAKDLFRRGKKVESRAKQNLERNPRRVDTGLLRSSINTQLVSEGGRISVRVGTNVVYGLYVHEGTGLYGPKGAYIYPKNKKYLSWVPKSGGRIFARRTRGMRPNRFLADAIDAAKG